MARITKLTMYSFGYWGWGTTTKQLVRMMDLAEKRRGNAPPMFVDIRIRRSARAPGFRERSFEKLVGVDRYLWEHRLGNEAIVTGKGWLKIANPAAAGDLLDIAVDCAARNQPVVFFCACEWPRFEGEIACHRTEVTKLLLQEGKSQGVQLTVVEWPGGDPQLTHIMCAPADYDKIAKGRRSIPISKERFIKLAGLPWGSIAVVKCKGMPTLFKITGPPKYVDGDWRLPLPWEDSCYGEAYEDVLAASFELRKEYGLDPVSSPRS